MEKFSVGAHPETLHSDMKLRHRVSKRAATIDTYWPAHRSSQRRSLAACRPDLTGKTTLAVTGVN